MKKIFGFITELMGWFQILLLPSIIGLFIGATIYFSRRDTLGLILGISTASLGLIVGVVIATRVSRKKGTVNFLARVSATPELDNLENPKK